MRFSETYSTYQEMLQQTMNRLEQINKDLQEKQRYIQVSILNVCIYGIIGKSWQQFETASVVWKSEKIITMQIENM